MKNWNAFILPLFAVTLLALGCKKDDPEPENEEELITTATLTFTPVGGGSAVNLKFSDPDGNGGNAATITGGVLQANKQYTISVVLLNESVSPAEDITAEVKEEAEEHQFFYQTTGASIVFAYDDADANGKPIGIKAKATTAAASKGTLTFILRHEPNKGANGVAAGDITNAGGETDISVAFPLEIK